MGSRVCWSTDALIKCFVGDVASIIRTLFQCLDDVFALYSERIRVARLYDIETLIGIAISTENDRCELGCERFRVAEGS